ncbi:hypothetical protein SEA_PAULODIABOLI_145 [Microbacterium phage PauloDiaboli]|nr:hypothetical protein SEA_PAULODIABOLI_145 [Microbacterium phage PauloDiaboli]QWY83977.1 membrane protein [Microbacterium phage A3Wally]
MGVLALILIIAALILFGFGIFVSAVKFLIWVAIALAVVAAIVWLVRYIRDGKSTTPTP